MLHSHVSNRTPLAKCSNLIKYVYNGLELGDQTRAQKKTSNKQLGKIIMIIRALIVTNYKCPVIDS